MTIDFSTIKLVILDLNGTLSNTPFIDKEPLHLLPGRKERLDTLRAQHDITFAIATNQGGVAFGYLTEQEAYNEVAMIAQELDISLFEISYGYPSHKKVYPKWSTPEMLKFRKPAPGMLLTLMERAGVSADETVMVGDREEDAASAKNAGIAFVKSDGFFKKEVWL